MTLPELTKQPEPWLRGTHAEVGAVKCAVLHALELADEDIQRWCGNLSEDELNARPAGIAPVAFHLRHVARSLDRLITYAEGAQLDVTQMTALKSELDSASNGREAMAEFSNALARSAARIRAIDPETFENSRAVGRRRLPTTVGGLLVHIADHTQRHVGQAVTTAKVVVAQRS
ncbi:MAG: DinB family protein [Candidatus Acidiferrales bacterium]